MTDQPTIMKPLPAVDEWLDPPIGQAYMGRVVLVRLDPVAVEKAGHAYYHLPVAVLVCENKLMTGLNPVPLVHNWVRSWKPL